jgi:hypothetical protein
MADGKYFIGQSLREKLKSTIAKVDSIPFGGPVSRIPTIASNDGPTYVPKVFRVCTATGAWSIDASKSVTFYGVTSTPNTVSVINKIVSLPAPRSTSASRIVNIAKDGTQWYLVSFGMSTATAVLSRGTQSRSFIDPSGTQSLTFVGSVETQSITFASQFNNVTVLTGVQGVIRTDNCTIVFTQTTTLVRAVVSTQTARAVSSISTQTATTISLAGTQTAAFVTGTFTATIITLEI